MNRENEDHCWESWLTEYGPRLVLFARQYVPSLPDAEDAVQEAFIRFWKSGMYRARHPLISLYSYTRRAAVDLYRSGSRRRQREKRSAEIRNARGPLFEKENEQYADIEESLMDLPEEQREVIVLRIWGGFTFRDIGRILNIPLNTAASRYRYGIGTMQDRLMKAEAYGS